MQSFRDVKREGGYSSVVRFQWTQAMADLLRRAFGYWHQATHTSINRRERLMQKEKELKISIVAAAWERWRDKFKEEKLRGIVRQFSIVLLLSC